MTTTGARTGELLYYSATEEVDSIAQDLYENFNSLSESHRNQVSEEYMHVHVQLMYLHV